MTADMQECQDSEHRREVRTPTAVRPGYRLSLRLPSRRRIGVDSSRNVSASGTSVALHQSVKAGSEVSLILNADGLQLEFAAIVTWCLREPPFADGATRGLSVTHCAGLSLRGPGSFAAMRAATTVAKSAAAD